MYIRFLIDTRIFHLAEIRAVKLKLPCERVILPWAAQFTVTASASPIDSRVTLIDGHTSKERDKSGLCEEISASIYRAEIEMRETSS